MNNLRIFQNSYPPLLDGRRRPEENLLRAPTQMRDESRWKQEQGKNTTGKRYCVPPQMSEPSTDSLPTILRTTILFVHESLLFQSVTVALSWNKRLNLPATSVKRSNTLWINNSAPLSRQWLHPDPNCVYQSFHFRPLHSRTSQLQTRNDKSFPTRPSYSWRHCWRWRQLSGFIRVARRHPAFIAKFWSEAVESLLASRALTRDLSKRTVQ